MKKCVSVVVALMMILTLFSGCAGETKQVVSTTTSSTTSPTKAPGQPVQTMPAAYEEILEDFRTLIEWKLTEGFYEKWNEGLIVEPRLSENLSTQLTDREELNALGGRMYDMALEMIAGYDDRESTVSAFGYILKDINDDDTPELFWVRKDRTLLAVFTVCDGKAKLLDAFWNRYPCKILDDNRLYLNYSAGTGYLDFEILKLDNSGNSVNDLSFGLEDPGDAATYWEQVADTERIEISEERFNELEVQYPFEWGSTWEALPITFFEETAQPEQTLGEKLTEKIEAELEKKLQNAADGGTFDYRVAYDTCAQEWEEVAEQYYDVIVAYEGWLAEWEEMSGNDRIIEDFRAAMEDYKTAWEEYEQSQNAAYDTIIGTIYDLGSLGSVALSEHQYTLCKQWALQVLEVYELMTNVG